MTPEAKSRLLTDQKLEAASCGVQDQTDLNFSVGRGMAVREYSTDTSLADCLFFVDRQHVGVIKSKRDEGGHNPSVHEAQNDRFANATLKLHKGQYKDSGQNIYVTDGADQALRPRELFHFFRSQTLADWPLETDTYRDEIVALSFFYTHPYHRRGLTFEMIEALLEALQRPPLMLTIEKILSAYSPAQDSKVCNESVRRQLADLVSLMRLTLGMDEELQPFAESVGKRPAHWVWRQNSMRVTAVTWKQIEWLRLVKDHIVSSYRIERDDSHNAQLAGKEGSEKAWNGFGGKLDELFAEMNEELVA